MKRKFPIVTVAALCTSIGLCACETLKQTGMFVPQGPGNAPDGVVRSAPQKPAAPAKAEAAAAVPPQPTSARSLSVAPELVATAPVPPVRGSDGAPVSPLNMYTQSTRYGDMIFISGQIPLDLRTNTLYDAASVEDQTRIVMENIRLILEANRMTMANVVTTTVYMKNVNDFRAMNSVYDLYFKGSPPARTVVEVNKLPRGVAIQISAVAGR